MSIVDSLRKLSLKLTGAYSTGEDIEDNIEYIAEQMDAFSPFKPTVVETLPETGVENVLYLAPKEGEEEDAYDEYIWTNSAWEKVGSMSGGSAPEAVVVLGGRPTAVITAANSKRGGVSNGDYSYAEGDKTTASEWAAHAEGKESTASGQYSHAEGYKTIASADKSHAEGQNTSVSKLATAAHAEGSGTKAQAYSAHAEGDTTIAKGNDAHAEGYGTVAEGEASHAEGAQSHATGTHSHAEGAECKAIGGRSHAEGKETTAHAPYSHVEGYKSVTGKVSQSVGDAAHAEGNMTTASGVGSHSEGYGTVASGAGSHAEGYGTAARGDYQHAGGKFNVEDQNDANGVYAEIIGNGTGSANRSNARTLDWQGNGWYAGNVTAAGGSLIVGSTAITEAQLQSLLALLNS